MVIIKIIYLIGGICLILGSLIYLFFRHQQKLKARAFLMREAVRNGDYAFRLPTSGLLPGERALQQALNDMQGDIVDSYRKLTQLQAPVVEPLPLASFLESIRALYPDLSWHIFLPQNVTLEADRNMLRQVFINLTKNAIEAHATDIDVRMSQNERPVLLFSNNGEPIPADVAREIFIPFFTTKSSGTGIGLSLSRQMLMMQNIELGLADTSISGYHVTFYLEKQKD